MKLVFILEICTQQLIFFWQELEFSVLITYGASFV